MVWKKKRRLHGKNQHYSLSRKLRRENKSNDEFEVMLNGLKLEELIGLKLELASKYFGGRMYGIPLWFSLKSITQDAMLKYALSATRAKKEAARLLGLSANDFRKLLKKYDIENYFEENKNNDLTNEN